MSFVEFVYRSHIYNKQTSTHKRIFSKRTRRRIYAMTKEEANNLYIIYDKCFACILRLSMIILVWADEIKYFFPLHYYKLIIWLEIIKTLFQMDRNVFFFILYSYCTIECNVKTVQKNFSPLNCVRFLSFRKNCVP